MVRQEKSALAVSQSVTDSWKTSYGRRTAPESTKPTVGNSFATRGMCQSDDQRNPSILGIGHYASYWLAD